MSLTIHPRWSPKLQYYGFRRHKKQLGASSCAEVEPLRELAPSSVSEPYIVSSPLTHHTNMCVLSDSYLMLSHSYYMQTKF